MQLAYIAPIPLLSFLENETYQFIIAPYCKKYPEYFDFYKRIGGYKIIDNGAWEMRKPMSPKEYMRIAIKVGADEIVLPDYEFKPLHTIARTREFAKVYKQYPFNTFDVKFQLVLHGTDYSDLLNKASFMIQSVSRMGIDVTVLGVPLYNKDWVGRIYCMYVLKQVFPFEDYFHLLGLHDPVELTAYGKEVRSADGSFPFKYGLQEIKWNHITSLQKIPRFSMTEKVNSRAQTNSIYENLTCIRQLARRSE